MRQFPKIEGVEFRTFYFSDHKPETHHFVARVRDFGVVSTLDQIANDLGRVSNTSAE